MHIFINQDKTGIGEGEVGDINGVLTSEVQKWL